jgi:hypothetical protein
MDPWLGGWRPASPAESDMTRLMANPPNKRRSQSRRLSIGVRKRNDFNILTIQCKNRAGPICRFKTIHYVSEILQLIEFKSIYRGLRSCLVHACPPSRAAQARRAGNNGMSKIPALAGLEDWPPVRRFSGSERILILGKLFHLILLFSSDEDQ